LHLAGLLFDHLCDEPIKIALHYEILVLVLVLDTTMSCGWSTWVLPRIAAGSWMRAQHELHTSSTNYRTGAKVVDLTLNEEIFICNNSL